MLSECLVYRPLNLERATFDLADNVINAQPISKWLDLIALVLKEFETQNCEVQPVWMLLHVKKPSHEAADESCYVASRHTNG